MKFKLDENFGVRTQQVFVRAGHNVQTVLEEELQGASDLLLYEKCCDERRCLVTLDLDFTNVIRFPPKETAGIVVIRFPKNPTLLLLETLIHRFLKMLIHMSIVGQLCIVEVDRIRLYQPEEGKESP
ncbi:DUF5615 family PIN-like protein [bacterium]|nr:DUF5615 family PIN-like protein [bacterium]